MLPKKIREALEDNYMKQSRNYLESLYCDIAFARLYALQKGNDYLEEVYEEIEELIVAEIASHNKERFMEVFKKTYAVEWETSTLEDAIQLEKTLRRYGNVK